ncbi:putative cleavage and polyadenylation specificity factor subunit 4-like protein isoform X1 [Loxodonta africana]|uniref:putative cleavage and polyadenylation specificity factor subunit 4-like protein isoform X1 n=1 Tax=Loxodonta africana TaxID=9785 RepID=UPI000C810DA6|nr:putative cleavage and polyadenylation specificity factor subunit 4-like protein isoform X2 [Loxodonta africana]
MAAFNQHQELGGGDRGGQLGCEAPTLQGRPSGGVWGLPAGALVSLGKRCPFRHDSGGRTVVCKHWLRGLCKKGDQCHFLHQYDVARMPECYFYSKFGDCNNKECSFLHVKPASKTQDCPWYDQGFCKNGPLCKYRHIHRVMCINYLAGFCPEGPKCQFTHLTLTVMAEIREFSPNAWNQQ